MTAWRGAWVGAWEGGESAGDGFVNASLLATGSGSATVTLRAVADIAASGQGTSVTIASAEVVAQPVPEAPASSGGAWLPPQRQRTRYAEARLLAAGSARIIAAAEVAQGVDAALVVSGTARVRLRPSATVAAAMHAHGAATAQLAPEAAQAVEAALVAAGASVCTLTARVTQRENVVELPRRLEIEDDEVAAILLLLAA